MKGLELQEIFRCAPEIDLESGYRYFLGNMNNYKQALFSILKSIKAKLPILQSMLLTREYEGLRTITQTLRKMLHHVGAAEMSELSYQLELVLLNEAEWKLQETLQGYISNLMIFSDHLELLLKNLDMINSIMDNDKISFGNYDFSKTKESIKLSEGMLKRKII